MEVIKSKIIIMKKIVFFRLLQILMLIGVFSGISLLHEGKVNGYEFGTILVILIMGLLIIQLEKYLIKLYIKRKQDKELECKEFFGRT